jgi:hypothetical protein
MVHPLITQANLRQKHFQFNGVAVETICRAYRATWLDVHSANFPRKAFDFAA